MSYRINEPKPPIRRRTMQDTATPGKIYVHNGCTANLAIPCWYLEAKRPMPVHPHNRQFHDMVGWPTPDWPDHCCQDWDFARSCCGVYPNRKCEPMRCRRYLDMSRLIPIHLLEEGYEATPHVYVHDAETDAKAIGVDCSATIDKDDDWVIRVLFDVLLPDRLTPENDPAVFYYSVYLEREDEQKQTRRDLAAMGELVVLPCPTVEHYQADPA